MNNQDYTYNKKWVDGLSAQAINELDNINELDKLSRNGDTEAAHWLADKVLCNLLNELGFEDVVNAWEKIDRWYA